ncbi:MAG: DUF6502 family protein [Nitrospira sp.]|nr:DUF6502 family protein [Nitrospira sp.]
MSQGIKETLLSSVLNILRPLMKILLRNGIPYGTFADLAKHVYVNVAMEECGLPNRKQSVSRVSVITGLTRKEVSRVKDMPAIDTSNTAERYNRAARVISGWVRDRRFTDNNGRPSDLHTEGEGATFSELVKLYSGDVPVRAVLDELLRVGIVERLDNGRVRLLNHAYIPHKESEDKLGILGIDVKDLISTIDHNLTTEPLHSFFQRKVSYDNLPEEVLPELHILSAKKGQALLEDIDRWLSQYDRDVNPAVNGTGRRRAGIGIYYFEENLTGEGEGH